MLLDEAFAAFAQPVFTPGRRCSNLQALPQDYTELQYETASTQVNTPALQALARRNKGVCRTSRTSRPAACAASGWRRAT